MITLLFAMIYKLIPDVSNRWKDVWIGAGMTSLLFAIGKLLIGLYLGKSDVGLAYGAAGSLIVILLWGLLRLSDILVRGRVHGGLCGISRVSIKTCRKCNAGTQEGGHYSRRGPANPAQGTRQAEKQRI